MLEYAYNRQLWIENTLKHPELILQAKAGEKSNPEVPHVLKALHSNASLLSSKWAINQITLSPYSRRCQQHCDVVLRIYVEKYP